MKSFMNNLKIELSRCYSYNVKYCFSMFLSRESFFSARMCSMYLFPLFVAALIFLAFIFRHDSSKSEFVIFFTTLYAFWVGLFSSCQLVNKELCGGEWSYWVLGFRRNFLIHFAALLGTGIAVSLIQLTPFALFFIILNICTDSGSLNKIFCNELGYIFPCDLGCVFSKYKYALFALSLVLPSVSGAGFGILLSSIFKEPADSLKTAVAFIVLVLVASHKVLDCGGDYGPSFKPIYVLAAAKERSGGSSVFDFVQALKDKGRKPFKSNLKADEFKGNTYDYGPLLLSDVSFFLPQRYFYNIANIFSRRVLNVRSTPTDTRLTTRFENSLDGTLSGFKKELDEIGYDAKREENLKKLIERHSAGLKTYALKIAMGEFAGLGAIFSLCVLFSLLIIYNGRRFYEIR